MVNDTRHILLVALASSMNRQQQNVIEHRKEVNRILQEELGLGRVQLNLAQKRRLSTAAIPAPSFPFPFRQQPPNRLRLLSRRQRKCNDCQYRLCEIVASLHRVSGWRCVRGQAQT